MVMRTRFNVALLRTLPLLLFTCGVTLTDTLQQNYRTAVVPIDWRLLVFMPKFMNINMSIRWTQKNVTGSLKGLY
jgi:hypothetical protein